MPEKYTPLPYAKPAQGLWKCPHCEHPVSLVRSGYAPKPDSNDPTKMDPDWKLPRWKCLRPGCEKYCLKPDDRPVQVLRGVNQLI